MGKIEINKDEDDYNVLLKYSIIPVVIIFLFILAGQVVKYLPNSPKGKELAKIKEHIRKRNDENAMREAIREVIENPEYYSRNTRYTHTETNYRPFYEYEEYGRVEIRIRTI